VSWNTEHAVTNPTVEVARELKALRRGRGLRASRIDEQVGPLLRAVCDITDDDDVNSIRQKVRYRLTELTNRLPDHLRDVVKSALGLTLDQGESLADRIEQLARQQNRDTRTIRRHIDAGFDKLADIVLEDESAHQGSSDAWHLRRFEAILLLDRGAPECYERRTIVAHHDGLDEITASITVPRPTPEHQADHGLLVDPYFGVRLMSTEQPSSTRFLYRLKLPHTLQIGQAHEFGLITRIPRGQPMRPHYVFFPGRFCEEFDLRVRFGMNSRPDQIWQVDNIFYPDLDNGSAAGKPISVDRAGEVHLFFNNLILGYGCGAQWHNE
jgi:hypothetical protein